MQAYRDGSRPEARHRAERPSPHHRLGTRESCGRRGGVLRCEAGKHDASGLARYGVGIVPHVTSEPPRRRRARTVGLVILVVIAGLFVWSTKHMTNDFALTPGLSQPVGPLIKVSGHPTQGTARTSILLTDVEFTPLSVWQWLWAELNPSREEVVESFSTLTAGDTPQSQIYTLSYLQMYDSQNFARAAAMRSLHLRVVGVPVGATVVAVGTGAPSAGALAVDDRVVWANGTVVRNECQLIAAVSRSAPGKPVALKVEHVHVSSAGVFGRYGPATLVHVPTIRVPPGIGKDGCPGNPTEAVSFALEAGFEDATEWHFPVSVAIDIANIGGPSAGLAMTLGILDALSKSPITGRLKIAATGTIGPDGVVGDVGGVAQKTIAVENAGATVFLVPDPEYGVARNAASGGLKVFEVATLQQALGVIRRLSGVTPVPIAGLISNRSPGA
jgi:PDZ domain-containing protein